MCGSFPAAPRGVCDCEEMTCINQRNVALAPPWVSHGGCSPSAAAPQIRPRPATWLPRTNRQATATSQLRLFVAAPISCLTRRLHQLEKNDSARNIIWFNSSDGALYWPLTTTTPVTSHHCNHDNQDNFF